MAGSVKEIDHGWIKLKAEMLKLIHGDNTVYIGIQGKDAERRDGGATNAEIGTWQEFGTGHIPERSFLRATIEMFREKYAKLIQNGVEKVAMGQLTIEAVFGLIGERVVADIRNRIKSGIEPALAAATLRRKTRKDGAVASVPLVLTGQLLHAISWVVRPRGAEQ